MNNKMSPNLIIEQQNGIATIRLNRPQERNVINYGGWIEIGQAAEMISKSEDIKVLIITGQGDESFSAGADIKDFNQSRSNSTQAKIYAKAFDHALNAIEQIPQPTISLIKGFCLGGGCELSMATDIRIASESSKFGIPAANLGVLIGYKEMIRLVNLVGLSHASDLLLTAKIIDATEALRINLVTKILPLDKTEKYVFTLAKKMTLLAPLSQAGHKKIIQTILQNPNLGTLTPTEENFPFTNFDSSDYQEGRSAFLEKRPPRFTGK